MERDGDHRLVTSLPEDLSPTDLQFTCSSTSEESLSVSLQPNVSEVYQDPMKVFSRSKSTFLLPHCTWDCDINLLADVAPPRNRIYPLSMTETQAMEEYIEVALHQGFI